MAEYPDIDELEKLWPEEGYAIIIEDEMKPPDSDDFVNVLNEFDAPDVELPAPKSSYSYFVHDASGNRYGREEWHAFRTLKDAIGTVLTEYPVTKKLQELKQKGRRWWKRDDIIWFEIVLSLSTLRGSYGSQIVVDDEGRIDEHRYGSVAFRTLEQVDPDHRYSYLESRLYGNVAMHPTKAEAMVSNFQRVKESYGGPQGVKKAFKQKDGVQAKMEFLKQFDWIGEKYARNIPMDLYLEDFREFIAIDTRIEGILRECGYPFENRGYDNHEQFLQAIAAELGLEPWELDRTLYNFEDEILAAM